jgi:5-(aminomethyl)-3-furanmethanol phosphate kinase
MATRIIKVGGSLFHFERLVPELRSWLEAQPAARNVLIAGGGAFTDAVRQWDQCFDLPCEKSHWLCIRLLDVSARALALILPEARFIDRFEELLAMTARQSTECLIYSAEEFLQRWEPECTGPHLPADWSVTSDSITVRIAQVIQAEELVLLKSADPPQPLTTHHAAQTGYVDSYFPLAAASLATVRCVNLRSGGEFHFRSQSI